MVVLTGRTDNRRRAVCDCGGYHFPHRHKSGVCYDSSRADYYHAVRAGVPEAECMALLSAADLDLFYPLPKPTMSEPTYYGPCVRTRTQFNRGVDQDYEVVEEQDAAGVWREYTRYGHMSNDYALTEARQTAQALARKYLTGSV